MIPRLIIITGKGGVGKTIFSLALSKHLQEKGHNVVYNSFDWDPPRALCKTLGIPALEFEDRKILLAYIEKKLKSRKVASWILKVPFFSGLFQMIPGLKNLVYLGFIIDYLKKNEDVTYILDSPSSGYVLTLLESPQNFKKIFKVGPMAHDILEMEAFVKNPEVLKTFVLALPSMMAINEAIELQSDLKKQDICSEILLNNSFSKNSQLNDVNLPDFLKKKSALEGEVFDWYQEKYGSFKKTFPHFFEKDKIGLINELKALLDDLLC